MPEDPKNHVILSGGTNDSMLGKSSIQQDQNMTPCREAFIKSWDETNDVNIPLDFNPDTGEASLEPFAEFWFNKAWQAAKADTAEEVKRLRVAIERAMYCLSECGHGFAFFATLADNCTFRVNVYVMPPG